MSKKYTNGLLTKQEVYAAMAGAVPPVRVVPVDGQPRTHEVDIACRLVEGILNQIQHRGDSHVRGRV